jgi:hypothetical protein
VGSSPKSEIEFTRIWHSIKRPQRLFGESEKLSTIAVIAGVEKTGEMRGDRLFPLKEAIVLLV